jgi:hypothetical protein
MIYLESISYISGQLVMWTPVIVSLSYRERFNRIVTAIGRLIKFKGSDQIS